MTERIKGEYLELERQRKEHLHNYNKYLYSLVPEAEKIDNEIASLAITCASEVVKGNITVQQAFSKMEQRRNELNELRKNLVSKAGVDEYKPLPFECDICSDTGVVGEEKCICYKKKVRKYMIEASGKISNFSCDIYSDTFDNFSLKYYDKKVIAKFGVSPYDYMSQIAKKCKDFCNGFNKESDNLFFTGEPGRGKTFFANCIANELLAKGIPVIYQSSYKLFQFLEDYKFGKLDRDTYEEYYKAIYDADMLIIDDLGTEFITAYTCSVFFDVINSRLLNNKKTIISTNLSMNDIANNYTERVASRIKGYFNTIYFIGDDIRIAKRNEK